MAPRRRIRARAPAQRLMMGLDFLQRIPLHGTCGVVHDVGCGSGELTRALYAKFRPKSCEALDSSKTAIRFARASDGSSSGICWRCGDARKWKPPEGSVDLVFSHLFVHWLGKAEHIDFLKRATAALKPGGIIAIAAPVLAQTRVLRALHDTAQRQLRQSTLAKVTLPFDSVRSTNDYRDFLNGLRFDVIHCETRTFHFQLSASELTEWVKTSILRPFTDHLSPVRKQKFHQAFTLSLADVYQVERGVLRFTLPVRRFVARRPAKATHKPNSAHKC